MPCESNNLITSFDSWSEKLCGGMQNERKEYPTKLAATASKLNRLAFLCKHNNQASN